MSCCCNLFLFIINFNVNNYEIFFIIKLTKIENDILQKSEIFIKFFRRSKLIFNRRLKAFFRLTILWSKSKIAIFSEDQNYFELYLWLIFSNTFLYISQKVLVKRSKVFFQKIKNNVIPFWSYVLVFWSLC